MLFSAEDPSSALAHSHSAAHSVCSLLGQLLFLPLRRLGVTQQGNQLRVWRPFAIPSTGACSSISCAPRPLPRMPQRGTSLPGVWFSPPALGGSTGITGKGTAALSWPGLDFSSLCQLCQHSEALWEIGKGNWEQTLNSNSSSAHSLVPLRVLLGSLAGSPRVVQCAETVPVLLELFFRVVAEVGPFGGVWFPAVPQGSLVM